MTREGNKNNTIGLVTQEWRVKNNYTRIITPNQSMEARLVEAWNKIVKNTGIWSHRTLESTISYESTQSNKALALNHTRKYADQVKCCQALNKTE